jgi:hypothetical protein
LLTLGDATLQLYSMEDALPVSLYGGCRHRAPSLSPRNKHSHASPGVAFGKPTLNIRLFSVLFSSLSRFSAPMVSQKLHAGQVLAPARVQ